MNMYLRVSFCNVFVILTVFCQSPKAQLQSFVSGIETFIDDVVGAKVLESALSRATLTSGKLESDSLVENVERIVSRRLLEHESVVNRLKSAIETEAGSGDKVATRVCCRDDEVAVSNPADNTACTHKGKTTSRVEPFMDEFLKEVSTSDTADVQRYLDSNGLLIQYPAQSGADLCKLRNHTNFSWFASARLSATKRLVILIGEQLLVSNRLESVEAISSTLQAISPYDKFNVVVFSRVIQSAAKRSLQCDVNELVAGTYHNKKTVIDWLNRTSWSDSQSDYGTAFETAFESLNYSAPSRLKPTVNTILFVTSSASTSDSRRIFEVFDLYKDLPVIIHTYGTGNSDGALLEAISEQNGTAYSGAVNEQAIIGRYNEIGELSELIEELSTYYLHTPNAGNNSSHWEWPRYDHAIKDGNLTLTVSRSVMKAGSFQGAVSASFSAEALFQDALIHLQVRNDAFGFVADSDGYVISHTLLAPISRFHPELPMYRVRELHASNGLENLIFSTIQNGVASGQIESAWKPEMALDASEAVWKKYEVSCKQTRLSLYVICVGVEENSSLDYDMSFPKPEGFTFTYHRLDLVDSEHACSHGRKLAFLESTVQMTADAFVDRARGFSEMETKDMIRDYQVDVMKEDGNIVKDQARQDIFLTFEVEGKQGEIIEVLPETHIGKIALWRYIATVNGVMRIWPGSQLPKNYDPRQSRWYRSAMSNRQNKFVVSTPYLDAITGEWVITFAKALIYPTNSPEKDVFGVIGFDIYLWQIKDYLSHIDPKCQEYCALANTDGYMMYHPVMISDNLGLYSHITQFEPELSNQLATLDVLRKSSCSTSDEDGEYNAEFYSFRVDRLYSQISDLSDNIAYSTETNVIFITNGALSETTKCHFAEDGECRENFNCQSPCKSKSEPVCRSKIFTLKNFTVPCRPTLWWSYEKKPDAPDELEHCYDHFEEADEGFDLSWIGGVIQGAVGLGIAGICAAWKYGYTRTLDPNQTGNAGNQNPNDLNFTNGMPPPENPEMTNNAPPLLNNIPFAFGSPMATQFGGQNPQDQSMLYSNQQQGFGQSFFTTNQPPPYTNSPAVGQQMPPPSYEASQGFQY